MLPCCFYIFRLQIPISTIHIALVSPSLRRTSAPIQFAIVLGVLGTQEISCIWLQGRLRETIFILHLPQIDKTLGHPLEGNLLLSYKLVHLQAQQRLQEEGCVVDINLSGS